MKELLLNSRASWAKRHNTEPATAFYNTDTGHNKSMGARLKTTPQRYSILRSGAPRFRRNSVSMRDGGHYNTDRTSVQYSVAHTNRNFSALRSAVPRFMSRSLTEVNVLPRPYRRPDKNQREHALLPKSTIVDSMCSNKATAAYHHRSIRTAVETTPVTMKAIRMSKTQRGAFKETGAPHLGPGSYNPERVGYRPPGSTKKPKLKLKKRDVMKIVSDDPDVHLTPEELELKRAAHLGPGAYFADERARDVAHPRGHPGVRWSQGPRFTAESKADSYKRNGSVLNPRRRYVEWVTPGNPMWREDRRERSATAGHKPSGADYMPTLDSGPKISLATAVAKGPRRFAFVFQSNQPRLAPPGSVTAASRREFTPCTGPALGPGAYNPTEFRPDDPPPFRSGQQRGDVRCWGDNFDALRPRHLLKAQGSTALLDT